MNIELKNSFSNFLTQKIKISSGMQATNVFKNAKISFKNGDEFIKSPEDNNPPPSDYSRLAKGKSHKEYAPPREADPSNFVSLLPDNKGYKGSPYYSGSIIVSDGKSSEIGNETVESIVFGALDGKAENANEIARQIAEMIFSTDINEAETKALNDKNYTEDALAFNIDIVTRTQNREEGRALAKYIADNYFDDPEEASAFMDKISNQIYYSELRDMGYSILRSINTDTFCFALEGKNTTKEFAYEMLGYTSEDWADPEKKEEAYRKQMEYEYKGASITRQFAYEMLGYTDDDWADLGKREAALRKLMEYERENATEHKIEHPAWGFIYTFSSEWLDAARAAADKLSEPSVFEKTKVTQSIIDSIKAQVKNVPIEDLLIKYNFFAKAA